jgi:hypothetical protein
MWLLHFLLQNAVGQAITADVAVGLPALWYVRRLLDRHHREHLAHAQGLHDEQRAALSRVRLAVMRAPFQKPPKDYRDSGPV